MGSGKLEMISDARRDGGAAQTPAFPIRPGMGDILPHRGWTQARKTVLAALLQLPCIVVIVGAPGTGKTLLLTELARALEAAGTSPVVYWRGDLAQGADATLADGASTRIVLVDEADRMSHAVLARLATQPGLGLVLAHTVDPTGDGAFGAAVGGRRLSVVTLDALSEGETHAFVAASLARAGRPADLIDADAVARIASYSGGVPRLVNKLASAALFISASEGSAQVHVQHVQDAATMSGLADHAELADADHDALSSGETSAPLDVPEIAPAELAAIAQSWADAAIVAQPPDATAAAQAIVARWPGQHATPAALDPPPLRATGDSRIAVPVATPAGGARRRAAAAALLVLGAGAAGWFALYDGGPAVLATTGGSPQAVAPAALSQLAVIRPAATPGVGGGERASTAPASAPAPIPAPVNQPADASVAAGAAKPDARTPALASTQAGPDAAHAKAVATALPALRPAPAPAAARAHASARPVPRPPHVSEADAGRVLHPIPERGPLPPEVDRQAGALLNVLREYSARDALPPERDLGPNDAFRSSGEMPRPPQADSGAGRYVGSYVMGPDGRRMFVQDP